MESYKPSGRNPYVRGMSQYTGSNRQGQVRCGSGCNVQSSSMPGSCNIKEPDSNSCDKNCKDVNPHMKHMPLAMGYVPMQSWGELYDPETALCQGTAFPDLNLIFCGSRGKM